jgi:hypothetical protein
MLLLGRCHMTLALRPELGAGVLEASLTTIKGYERATRVAFRLHPQVDPFGSLVWRGDNALLMTQELIIKRMFEDIARAGAAGD